MTTTTSVPEGVDLNSLSPGSRIDIETKNRHYRIECLGGNTMKISGHPEFCPAPVQAELRGAVSREGTFETGFIRPGKRLMFLLGEHQPVTTSKVVSVHVKRAASSHSVH